MLTKRLLFLSLAVCSVLSKNTSAEIKDSTSKFSISGYVDAYYAYYTDSVGINEFQKFPTVSPRSNQFGLNTAMITLQYEDTAKVRGVVTLHYGDIAASAWPEKFNNIMEAHAGVRLCRKLWLDAGFFRTHLGTEGLLPKENFASWIAVPSYYEPYFESGFRLNYNASEKLTINLFVLNGYNIFLDNNDKKSLGLLATYALGDKGNVGYSNYVGDDSPKGDSLSHMRIHQNLFFNYQVNKLKMQFGMDMCLQKNSTIAIAEHIEQPPASGSVWAGMFSGLASFKYQFRTKCAAYLRADFFNDPQGFMSAIIVDKDNYYTGYQMWGLTAGVEYKPTDNSYIRLEGRNLEMNEAQEIFHWKGDPEDSRMEVMVNMGITF